MPFHFHNEDKKKDFKEREIKIIVYNFYTLDIYKYTCLPKWQKRIFSKYFLNFIKYICKYIWISTKIFWNIVLHIEIVRIIKYQQTVK